MALSFTFFPTYLIFALFTSRKKAASSSAGTVWMEQRMKENETDGGWMVGQLNTKAKASMRDKDKRREKNSTKWLKWGKI